MAFDNIDPPMADFSGALGMSGVHRIIDNATAGLPDVVVDWKDGIRKAKAVCKMLRGRDNLPKYLARCFASPLGQQMHQTLKSFDGWIHEGRWGTIAFSVPELLRVKGYLRWGWNKGQFLRGDEAPDANAAGNDLVEQVDAAISSSRWWAWLLMISKLCDVLRAAIKWIEGCPCHTDLLRDHDVENGPDRLRRDVDNCPLKCRRSPEISAGELLAEVGRASAATAAELAVALPHDLEPAVRIELLTAFDAGRTHITFYIGTNLHYVRELPWAVCQVAHLIRDVAEAAIRRCLDSNHPHPLLQASGTFGLGRSREMCDRPADFCFRCETMPIHE